MKEVRRGRNKEKGREERARKRRVEGTLTYQVRVVEMEGKTSYLLWV